jgi:hypothetical protein
VRWSGTYSHTLAIAVDIATASVFWNTADVCVSPGTGIELRRRKVGIPYSRRLAAIGDALEWIQPGHCEASIAADLERIEAARALLNAIAAPTLKAE